MSKHIPLPLERRGSMIWTKDEVLNRPKYICACSTVEQAEEIIEALTTRPKLIGALQRADEVLTDIRTHWVPFHHDGDRPSLTSTLEKAVAADHEAICAAITAATQPKKETTP